MIHRRVVAVIAAVLLGLIAPGQAHAQPPSQCLTNTPKGKQIYIPCDLLNARVNYPPGQRCQGLGSLEAYPKDVRDWCG